MTLKGSGKQVPLWKCHRVALPHGIISLLLASLPGKHKTLKKDDTEQQLEPKNLILHPAYHPTTFQYDLGLVELSSQVVLNDYVMPVCFPDGSPSEGKSGLFVLVASMGQRL